MHLFPLGVRRSGGSLNPTTIIACFVLWQVGGPRMGSNAASPPGSSYLGCYQDSVDRVLSSLFAFGGSGNSNMTVELCAGTCNGYPLFGLEAGDQCFCGNKITPGAAIAKDASSCNVRCRGNTAEICGGGWLIDVYSLSESSTSSTGSTLSPTSTQSPTTSTTSPTPAATSSQPPSPHSSLGVGSGIGIGLGIAAFVSFVLALLFYYWKQRRRQRGVLADTKPLYQPRGNPAIEPGSETPHRPYELTRPAGHAAGSAPRAEGRQEPYELRGPNATSPVEFPPGRGLHFVD